jgi:chemotaxis protein histidine kinase CheA
MSTDAFKLYFAELCADYRRQLPVKLAKLEKLWDCAANGIASPDRMSELQRDLHTLVGTAQTMGLPATTDAARAAETCLASFLARSKVPDPAGQKEFSRLLAKLKESAGIKA